MASVNPGFISHEFFHRYTWILPETHDKWYYYIPRENKNFDVSYQNFSKSVDKNLKEMVQFLQSKKMYTNPTDINVKRVYDNICNNPKKLFNCSTDPSSKATLPLK
jgi:hypothetical protein